MMIDLVISASRSSVPAELLTGECQCPSVDGTRSGDTGTSYLTLTLLRYIRRYIQTLILSTLHSLAKISLSSFAQLLGDIQLVPAPRLQPAVGSCRAQLLLSSRSFVRSMSFSERLKLKVERQSPPRTAATLRANTPRQHSRALAHCT